MSKKLYIVLAVFGYMQLGQAAAGPIVTTYEINNDVQAVIFENLYANVIKNIAIAKAELENLHAILIENITRFRGTIGANIWNKFYTTAREDLDNVVDFVINDILNKTDFSQAITPHNSNTLDDLKKRLFMQLKTKIMKEYRPHDFFLPDEWLYFHLKPCHSCVDK